MSEHDGQPERIGRYLVERVLGRGAMGVVYKAHDPAIDRPVAVKLVRADLLSGDERVEFLERFRREAQAAARCAHPHIVAIYDYEVHNGNPFLAMEYVEGASLAQVLARTGRFAPAVAVAVMLQVLEALGRAHALGIVHRDIKPANILMLADGQVKVTDFGISRLESVGITQAGAVLGTPSYMSPEQCRGEAVDGRSDLFSAGAVLYELLAGQRPFPGRSFAEVAQRVLNATPPDLRPILGAAAGLAGVLDRALAKLPEKRFADAAGMEAALRGALAAPDATVVAAGVDPALVARIEGRLAEHVGPMARVLVRRAAAEAPTAEALVAAVAGSIGARGEREKFVRAALAGEAGTGTAPATSLSPEVLERVQQDLARCVGPIARVLVRRAAHGMASEAALREALAGHIEAASERADFLRHRPGR